MLIAETEIRVRYGETDQMGYVYYGNYAQYYEVGRVEALRKLGLSYREMEDKGVMMPVIHMESKFVKAATYDEVITVKSIISDIPVMRFRIVYEIFNSKNELVNKGETTLVFIDRKTNKLIPCPEYLTEKMKPYFN